MLRKERSRPVSTIYTRTPEPPEEKKAYSLWVFSWLSEVERKVRLGSIFLNFCLTTLKDGAVGTDEYFLKILCPRYSPAPEDS